MSHHFVTWSTSALVIHFQLGRQRKHIFSQLKQTLKTVISSYFVAIILVLCAVSYGFLSVTPQIIIQ